MAGEEWRDCKEEEEEEACRLTDGSREKPFPSHASHEVVAQPLRTKNEREEMENCRAVFAAMSSYFSSWTDSTASSVLQSGNFHSFSLSPINSVSRHFALRFSWIFFFLSFGSRVCYTHCRASDEPPTHPSEMSRRYKSAGDGLARDRFCPDIWQTDPRGGREGGRPPENEKGKEGRTMEEGGGRGEGGGERGDRWRRYNTATRFLFPPKRHFLRLPTTDRRDRSFILWVTFSLSTKNIIRHRKTLSNLKGKDLKMIRLENYHSIPKANKK